MRDKAIFRVKSLSLLLPLLSLVLFIMPDDCNTLIRKIPKKLTDTYWHLLDLAALSLK
jgi:hypothetical protein